MIKKMLRVRRFENKSLCNVLAISFSFILYQVSVSWTTLGLLVDARAQPVAEIFCVAAGMWSCSRRGFRMCSGGHNNGPV